MMQTQHDREDQVPLLCARCRRDLLPGSGDFYVVRIEAFADPAMPDVSGDDVARDHRREIGRLLDELKNLSEQELLDQVYRRVVLHLCGECYRQWIESPVGP